MLAPYGRMALTNYLAQSLICSVLFYGQGFGYYGLDRIGQLGIAIAIVGVQVPMSHWWLSRFRYGPMEWLWRAITYWNIPAMRLGPGNSPKSANLA